MVWKILKITGIVIVLLIVALFALPYFFQDAIKAKIASTINENVDATVSFADADLSLFRNFPQASVNVDQLLIINKAPFAGDTLAALGDVDFSMSIRELFKGNDEPINIDGISAQNGVVNILFNKDGIGNFDIALENAKKKDDGKTDPMALKIKQYNVDNFKFRYFDERSGINLVLDSLYHSGTGDFTEKQLDLVTKSATRVSLDIDKTNFMNRVPITLDAVLDIDMENSKYAFKDNKALINRLPLEFDGYLKLLDQGQEYDLTFKTPSSSFTNFLALIPSKYSGSLANVKTSGDFTVNGFARGIQSETTVPKFNIAIASNNASFQYPDLPKAVRNIVIDTKIVNETGQMNDTYVNIGKLQFAIDSDVFNASANIRNVAENALVNAKLQGTINLGNLSQAYPIKLDKPLSGILRADVKTDFDMASVENNNYENIKNSGTINVSGFKYVDDAGKALNISRADVQFNPSRVHLQQLSATTGKSDMDVSGTLDNFYGFLFRDQQLKGNFTLRSNQFAVSDFMSDASKDKNAPKNEKGMKIPAFLDCTLNASANSVLYDNLVLKDVSGVVTIRDQRATLTNVKTNIFGGQLAVSGNVSTKTSVPTFEMDLNMNAVDIAQTFTQLDMFRNIAPVAGAINGKLNSRVKVSGNLDAMEMTPVLGSVSGDMATQLLSTTVNASNSTLLTALDNNLKFIDLQKLNLNDLKAALTFDNGKVNLKPVDIKYQDISLRLNGQHGFDQSMNYNIKFDVPAKYLGPEVGNLLAKLTATEAAKLENLPINAVLTGNFKNPRISTDVKQAAQSLTAQIVKIQKDKLVKQGTDALGNILGGNKPKDSANTSTANPPKDIKTQVGNAVKDLFNKKPTKKEPAETPAKEN